MKDIMITDVKTVEPKASIQEAARLMREWLVGSLIVVDNGALKGIITDGDILRRVVADAKDVTKTKVSDAMTKEIIMVEPDMELHDAVDVMMEKHVKKLPVVQGNQLVGIMTTTDVCRTEPKMAERVGELVFSGAGQQKRVAG